MTLCEERPVTEYTLSDATHRDWAERAAAVDIPPLAEEPRCHARSICDELDDRGFEDDPYIVALAAGAMLARLHLPPDVLEGLRLLKEGRLPYMLIRNVPTGTLAWSEFPSPAHGIRPTWKRDWTSEMTLLGTVQAAGLEAFGYFDEARGSLVQDLSPAEGWECTNGEADRQGAAFHTDNAIQPRHHRAEGIGMLGLINDGNVRIMVATVQEILERLTPDQIQILSRERYALSPNLFDDGRPFVVARAIFTCGPRGDMEINAAMHAMQPCCRSPELRETLDALKALEAATLPPVARTVIVGHGDLLLMSNVGAVHALHASPGRRWLQRVFYRSSLDGLRSNSRTADTRLARRFHSSGPATAAH